MKKIYGYMIERYSYDSRKERDQHVEQMNKNGWDIGSKIKEFTSRLPINNFDDGQYWVWFAEFRKTI